MAATSSILFDPTPDIAAAVIAAFPDPSISFDHLAAAANTSAEALAAWLSLPEIRERIDATDRSITWRNRVIANRQLHAVAPALLKILNDHAGGGPPSSEPRSPPIDTLDPETSPESFRHARFELRRAETVRKAGALLVSLARTRTTATPDLPAAPAPAPATSQRPDAAAPASIGPAPLDPPSEDPNAPALDPQPFRAEPGLDPIAEDHAREPLPEQSPHTSPRPPSRHRGPNHQPEPPRTSERPGSRESAAAGTREHWP